VPPRPRKDKPTQALAPPAPAALTNAQKRSTGKGFQRDTSLKTPTPAMLSSDAVTEFEELRSLAAGEIGSGRGLTYEWEFFVANLLGRIQSLEGGGGGGGGGGVSYVHTQSAAAATWSITHAMGTKPVVTVVSVTGQQLLTQVDYPDNNTTVITHAMPYAGTAYLRG
jgi:hypothetical protein